MLLAKNEYDDGKPLITAGTEAHLLMLYKNNYARWKARVEYYHEVGQLNAKLPTKKKKSNGIKEPDPYHDALYTSEDKGRATYGSISEEGLQYYDKARKEIKEERKKRGKKMLKLEKQWLEKLQEKNDGKLTGKKRERQAGDGDADDGGAAKKTRICESDDEELGSDDEEVDENNGEADGEKEENGHDSDATEPVPTANVVESV